MASNPDFWWWTHPFFHVFPPAAAVGGLEFGLAAGGAAEQLARLEGLRPGVARWRMGWMGWDGKAGGKTRVFGGKATEKLKKTWVNLSTVTIGAWPAWLCFNFCLAWKWWKWSEPSMWSGTLNGAARFLWLVIFLFPSLGKVTHVHLGMAPIRVSP